MPTSKTKQLEPLPFKKIGILAGNGALPRKLANSCSKKGIEPFIIAFEGQTPRDTVDGYPHAWCNLGAAGKIMKTLKAHDVQDLVLIGGIKRPAFSELKPDIKGAEVIARIGMKALGDNNLLELLKNEFSREGFSVHGIQHFLSELLAGEGVLGKIKPTKKMYNTIVRGVRVSQEIGRLDIGQSVIVQQGIVMAVEGIEGTDELIRRSKGYLRKGEGAILVKTSKPQQDKSLDLPTIGPDTIMMAADSGLAGIVIEAGSTVLVDFDTICDIADRNKIFIMGIDVKDYGES